MKYIATRPRAERLGDHGLFSDENGVDLAGLTATERGIVALMERLQQTQELEVDKLKREVEHTLVGRNRRRDGR